MSTEERPAGGDDRPDLAGSQLYDAFISYSHAADGLLAPRLQSALQRFAKPWWKRRAIRIFRDESSLSANPHLWSSITEALDSSGWFVLLLSPDAARSEWVNQEIQYWLEHRDSKRILPVLTDGEFVWAAGEVSGSGVPAALVGAFPEEPRWVDLRFARMEEQLDLQHAGFSSAVADIAAAIRGIPKDELASEEVRQHRRTVRTAWAAGVVVVVLGVASVLFGLASARNANEADRQREIADREREVALLAEADADDRRIEAEELQARAEQEVRRLSAAALAETAMGVSTLDPALGVLLAKEAIAQAVEASISPMRAVAALHVALQEHGAQFPSQAEILAQQGSNSVQVTTVLGPDGKRGVFAIPLATLLAMAESADLGTLSSEQCSDYLGVAPCPPDPTSRIPAERLGTSELDMPASQRFALQGTDLRFDSTFASRTTTAGLEEAVLSSGVFEEFELWGDNFGVDPFGLNQVGITGLELADFNLLLATDLTSDELVLDNEASLESQPSGFWSFSVRLDPFDVAEWLRSGDLERKEPPSLTNALRGTDGSLNALWVNWQPFGIWYRGDLLEQRGLQAPRSWEEVDDISQRLIDDGIAPWCLGGRAEHADRYFVTLLAATVAALEGAEFYDAWISHRIAADDQAILEAFGFLDELLFTDGQLDVTADAALRRPWAQPAEALGAGTPTCAMWMGTTLEAAKARVPLSFVPLPSARPDTPTLLTSGAVVAFNTDRPETRALAGWVASPFFGEAYSASGFAVAANREIEGTSGGLYTGPARELADAIGVAIEADGLRATPHSYLSLPDGVRRSLEKAVRAWLDSGLEAVPGALSVVEDAWQESESQQDAG